MIEVGIHENIEIKKVDINDKNSLVITLGKKDTRSIEERMNSADDSSSGETEQQYIIWPIQLSEYVKTGDDVMRQARNLKKALSHILKGYLPEKNINWNLLAGIPLQTPDGSDIDINTEFVKESVMTRLYNNIAEQFKSMVEPFAGKGLLFRVKLVRTSKNSHYSSIPKATDYSNLQGDPFWESMEVPKEQSKVAFSNYEKGYRKDDKDGQPSGTDLSDGTPVATNSAPDPKEEEDVNEVFGTSEV